MIPPSNKRFDGILRERAKLGTEYSLLKYNRKKVKNISSRSLRYPEKFRSVGHSGKRLS